MTGVPRYLPNDRSQGGNLALALAEADRRQLASTAEVRYRPLPAHRLAPKLPDDRPGSCMFRIYEAAVRGLPWPATSGHTIDQKTAMPMTGLKGNRAHANARSSAPTLQSGPSGSRAAGRHATQVTRPWFDQSRRICRPLCMGLNHVQARDARQATHCIHGAEDPSALQSFKRRHSDSTRGRGRPLDVRCHFGVSARLHSCPSTRVLRCRAGR